MTSAPTAPTPFDAASAAPYGSPPPAAAAPARKPMSLPRLRDMHAQG